jgi:hypothetical protein
VSCVCNRKGLGSLCATGEWGELCKQYESGGVVCAVEAERGIFVCFSTSLGYLCVQFKDSGVCVCISTREGELFVQ